MAVAVVQQALFRDILMATERLRLAVATSG
jgi:hypothetical protein